MAERARPLLHRVNFPFRAAPCARLKGMYMRYLTIAGLLLLAQLSCLPALAAPDAPAKSTTKLTPAQLKDAHKALTTPA